MEALFVHGGVSGLAKSVLPDLSDAVAAGLRAMTAIDAVEQAIRVLEDDARLNAGYGAVLTHDGMVELDAGIADGSSGKAAGVASVQVRHPISLARRVMDETPHVLVVAQGAMDLGSDMKLLEATTVEEQERWISARDRGDLDLDHYGDDEHVDTVGAVALDGDGALAAGSSTGGVFGKMRGRVGDAPIIGAGVFASRSAAVIGTGVGELFLRTMACTRVGLLVDRGADPQTACEEVVGYLGSVEPLAAGLLALGRSGAVGAAYRGGSWSIFGPDGKVEPIRLD